MVDDFTTTNTLPTEDGLYVAGGMKKVEWARVYRLREGEWFDVSEPDADRETVYTSVRNIHNNDKRGLVRLAPEK